MKKFDLGDMPAPIEPDLRERLLEVETATVGHFRHWGFMHPGIRALGCGRRIAGTAVTLALPAQDSTMLHHALGELRPGHIVVIDRLGDTKHACWGGGVTLAASVAGASGAVIDGPCTDPHEIEQHQFPVWSRGVSPITTRIYGLGGRLNKPISCGGVVVNPGDFLICDENGILVLPPDDVEETIAVALDKQARGRSLFARMKGGEKIGDMSGASSLVLQDS